VVLEPLIEVEAVEAVSLAAQAELAALALLYCLITALFKQARHTTA
jgi:hypothetical protein